MNIKEQVEQIISEAKYLEVSDIHFHPLENEVKIYYRIMNNLIFQKEITLDIYTKILRYLKFRTKLDISITKKPQDGAFYIENKKEKIFIRISTIPLINHESLVIRILQDIVNQSIENIAYNKNDLINIKKEITNKVGLFIFTGPTSSGKTTTIYSIIDRIVSEQFKKVITIENPVEIINPKFMQVQIDEKLNIDYAISLKATLRQDPDIIMIGEIRDEQTARNVFRAALTGHTVISTMHTKDIYGVVERFLDFGFLRSEIESILIGISNQRLILNEQGYVKAVYAYEIGESLEKVIRQEKKVKVLMKKLSKYKMKILKEKVNFKKVTLNKNKISIKNQKIILKNISLLLKQGYSINESISLLHLEEESLIYKNFLQGEMFYKILQKLNFDKDILLIIQISEQSGELDNGINKSYKMLEQKLKNKNDILDKLKYPLILAIFLLFALLFISNFLIPTFLNVYENFGIEVEGFFLIFIIVLENLPKIIILLLIFFSIFIIYFKIINRSDRLKLLLKHKFIKKQYYKLYNKLFLFNIYSLLSLGIKLDEVFLILGHQRYNYMLEKECQKIYEHLYKGEDLEDILIKRKIYNKKIIVAIKEGINSNTLLENLHSILMFEEIKQKQRINKIVLLIQPIIYLIFGLTIVLLYMSIFIPMFKIMDAI